MRDPAVLLTGASGLIGRAMAGQLFDCGIVYQANFSSDVDLANKMAVRERYRAEAFDLILHFASRGVRGAADDPELVMHEAAMARNLLSLVRPGGVFLYAGSMAEYGRSGVLNEDMICRPKNAYGRAKHETGNWLRATAPTRDVRPLIVRIFGAYGPGEGPRRLFPEVLAALKKGEPVNLSDGSQIRDFIYTRDVAQVCLDLVLAKNTPQCVNVGTGRGLTVRAVVSRIATELGADSSLLRFGARERSPHDQQKLVADTHILRTALGRIPPQRLSESRGILNLLTK